MKRSKVILLLLMSCVINLFSQQNTHELTIIPKPSFSKINDGYFVLTAQTKISLTHFGKIPHCKTTLEKDSWLFCDEIQVN